MFEAKNIAFAYSWRKKVLRDVSLRIESGETVGLLGANGTGKTTLLKVFASVLLHDAGVIKLNDVDPLRKPLAYRKQIGWMSELCPLPPEMTVAGYLTFRDAFKGDRTLRIKRRVKEVMSQCGLSEVANSTISRLSMGFRKRIAIADALLRRPTLLLLDDPLPGIDAVHRRAIIELLKSPSQRCATLVSGHEVREMAEFCTRFLLLKDGCIAAEVTGVSAEERAAVALKVLAQ